ncbi:hypothetical protein ES703_115727 [subsurface metagenome]
MDEFHGHNHYFAVRDSLVLIKLGVNLKVAISSAMNFHDVNLTRLTGQVNNIISATDMFYNTYDLKDVDFSTGTEQLPDFYFKSVEKEGDAGDIRVDKIIKLVKERYNIK